MNFLRFESCIVHQHKTSEALGFQRFLFYPLTHLAGPWGVLRPGAAHAAPDAPASLLPHFKRQAQLPRAHERTPWSPRWDSRAF